jgi:hypothetical protein
LCPGTIEKSREGAHSHPFALVFCIFISAF